MLMAEFCPAGKDDWALQPEVLEAALEADKAAGKAPGPTVQSAALPNLCSNPAAPLDRICAALHRDSMAARRLRPEQGSYAPQAAW